MSEDQTPLLETDPRFPSGPWVGFFLQKEIPGKHSMEMRISFQNGALVGEGRDWVGNFTMRGRYFVEDGKAYWTKRYAGKHDVFYQGFNEGKGIWGTWEIAKSKSGHSYRGGFHIWPEAMPDPTTNHLAAEADIPTEATETKPVEVEKHEEELVPAGTDATS